MAATLTSERFTGPERVFDRKIDGIRMLAFKRGGEVRLLSRNQLPLNQSYPSVVAAVAQLPVQEAILDGEALGVWGNARGEGYHVFDLLWLDGRDLTSLELDQRRALLEALVLPPPLQLVPRLSDDAP